MLDIPPEPSPDGCYTLTCGAENGPPIYGSSDPVSIEFLPQPLNATDTTAEPRVVPLTRQSNGCGATLHTRARPESTDPAEFWLAPADGVKPGVVPLDAEYFPAGMVESLNALFAGHNWSCGCSFDGVGCAVCGNAIGFRCTKCHIHKRGGRLTRETAMYLFRRDFVSPNFPVTVLPTAPPSSPTRHSLRRMRRETVARRNPGAPPLPPAVPPAVPPAPPSSRWAQAPHLSRWMPAAHLASFTNVLGGTGTVAGETPQPTGTSGTPHPIAEWRQRRRELALAQSQAQILDDIEAALNEYPDTRPIHAPPDEGDALIVTLGALGFD